MFIFLMTQDSLNLNFYQFFYLFLLFIYYNCKIVKTIKFKSLLKSLLEKRENISHTKQIRVHTQPHNDS